MAKIIDTKTPAPFAKAENNTHTLTVVVLDEKSQPAKDAKVSITPSDASGTTNEIGEIQFTLSGNNTKYDITAKAGGKTVIVPYYVTRGGATRLVVNPVYVQSIEAQLHPWWRSSSFLTTSSVVFGIIIILIIIWKFFLRKK
jgi:hypothetical protein